MTDGRNIRLLLVDDEVGYLEVLKKRLSHRGMDVVACDNGRSAVQAARKNVFDVAVVDLKMDEMDGLEVLKILKRMDSSLAVIILTGHGSEEAAREGLCAGAFDYLTKPCDLGDLVNKIKEAHGVPNQA
jgi:DNA-binding response OmpR family regulator